MARLVGCMNFLIFLLLVFVMPLVATGVLIALTVKSWRNRRQP